MYIFIYIYIYIYIYLCIYMCTYTHTHTHMCVYIHTHTHSHSHTHTPAVPDLVSGHGGHGRTSREPQRAAQTFGRAGDLVGNGRTHYAHTRAWYGDPLQAKRQGGCGQHRWSHHGRQGNGSAGAAAVVWCDRGVGGGVGCGRNVCAGRHAAPGRLHA